MDCCPLGARMIGLAGTRMGGLAMGVASGGRLGGARRPVDSEGFECLTPGQIQDCTKKGAEIALGPSARGHAVRREDPERG